MRTGKIVLLYGVEKVEALMNMADPGQKYKSGYVLLYSSSKDHIRRKRLEQDVNISELGSRTRSDFTIP
jgi:hypothetical protein